MQRAYGVMGWNVSGGHHWIRSDRFDVSATANISGNLAEDQLRPMLQRLLAERFKLKIPLRAAINHRLRLGHSQKWSQNEGRR